MTIDIDYELAQANAIADKAEAEGRELTPHEVAKIEIHSANFHKGIAELEQSRGRKTDANGSVSRNHHTGRPDGGAPIFKDTHTGEQLRAFSGREAIDPGNSQPVGEYFRSLLLNDTSSLGQDLQAAATVGSDSGGGYLLTPAMSSRIVDLARSASVCMSAGCITMPMSSAEMVVARITSDPSTSWRSETQSIASSSVGFGRYVLRPKMLSCLIPVSLELLEDASNSAEIIEQVMRNKMGQQLDYAILNGSGASGEPLGILSTSGTNAQSSIGALSDYTEVSNAVRDIYGANFDGMPEDLAWILPPAVAAAYDQLPTGLTNDATPLPKTEWVSKLRTLYTTNLQAGTGSPVTYSSIVGHFPSCLVAMRDRGIVTDILDSGSVTSEDGDTYNAVSSFMRFIRCRLRVDVLTMRPDWFSTLTGINP